MEILPQIMPAVVTLRRIPHVHETRRGKLIWIEPQTKLEGKSVIELGVAVRCGKVNFKEVDSLSFMFLRCMS